MRKFYQSSYYFWIISKFVLAIAGIVSVAGNLQEIEYLRSEEKLANYIVALYALLLVLDIIFSFNGKYYKSVKYTTGTLSIITGLVLFILMLYMNVISIPLKITFIVWIILLGLFDLLLIKRRADRPDETS